MSSLCRKAFGAAAARQLLTLLCALLALWGLGHSAWRISAEGPGVLGINNQVPWGWDIVQFVFWIGLGHAGTLISAILLLTRQHWRNGIARQAELMTLCAVATAAVFPLLHVGRIWMLWMMSPVPLSSGVWPNLASPLCWDCIAIGSYFLLSVLFFGMSLYGDLRMRENQRADWGRACCLMAWVLSALVITVHSVVGSDFAVTLRWHAPYLPPYFVCGALLSGMAAVQLIALLKGRSAELQGHLCKLCFGFALGMGGFYACELIQQPDTWSGQYAAMLLLNVALPSLYALPALRRSNAAIALISTGILLGMWLEREHIIIGRSLLATSGHYSPSPTDVAMLLGSIGLFLALYLTVDARLPEDKEDPLHAPSAAPGQRAGALLGAAAGLGGALLWAALSQYGDTAGQWQLRPHGPYFQLPALFVCALLGAGLAIFLQFLHRLRS